MAGHLRSDQFIMGGRLRTAGITGDHLGHAAHMLEHTLHAPEATAGEHGRLARGRRCFGRIDCGSGNRFVDGIGFGRYLQGRARQCGQERQDAKAAHNRIYLTLRFALILSYVRKGNAVTSQRSRIHQRSKERPINAPRTPTAAMPSVYQITTNGAALSLQ